MLVYFHVFRMVVVPNKADAVLIVYAYAVLAFSVTVQRLQAIAGRTGQISQFGCVVQHLQLSLGRFWPSSAVLVGLARLPELSGGGVSKRPNHMAYLNARR